MPRRREEEAAPSYYTASDVLPLDLVEDLIAHLGVAQKVTFAPSGRPYTYSESRLPAKLADRCREELDKRDILKRRVVFVNAPRADRMDPSVGQALIERGWSPSVVAVVIGYHHITLRRWGIAEIYQKVKKVRKPKIDKSADTLALGFTRFQQLFPGKEASQMMYYKIGSALMDAANPDTVARSTEIKAHGFAKSPDVPSEAARRKRRYS